MKSVEKRRCRGDLIEMYELMTNKGPAASSRFFQMSQRGGLRGHRITDTRFSGSQETACIKQRFFSSLSVKNASGE